jgi:hypothetical protein
MLAVGGTAQHQAVADKNRGMFPLGALEKPSALRHASALRQSSVRGRRLFAGHWWTATSGTSLPRAVLPQVDGANHPQQSDNFAPSMMIAAIVLAEVAVEIVASEIAGANWGPGWMANMLSA